MSFIFGSLLFVGPGMYRPYFDDGDSWGAPVYCSDIDEYDDWVDVFVHFDPEFFGLFPEGE